MSRLEWACGLVVALPGVFCQSGPAGATETVLRRTRFPLVLQVLLPDDWGL